MIGVRRGRVTAQFGHDGRAATTRVLVLLEDEHHGTFGQHKSVAILIVGP